jgi:hypothetical protein
VSKFNLPAPAKITIVGNSNSVEAKKKEDVTELGAGTDGFLWQATGDTSASHKNKQKQVRR